MTSENETKNILCIDRLWKGFETPAIKMALFRANVAENIPSMPTVSFVLLL